ncbi:hypothetical protein H9P43_006358 [Blastocladiella emersonii ATCC 22665]|nr:hypothetical protein H9P43_006358 [Blastocladiella emersonii ATCC 22665]
MEGIASPPPLPPPRAPRRVVAGLDVDATLHEHRIPISASAAAVIGNIAGYPFDSVKTRMQVTQYPSISHCIRHTYATEGVPGFFRGILPQLATVSLFKTASFSAYVRAKEGIMAADAPERRGTAAGLLLASFGGGFCSGIFTAFLTQPLELIKVLRQLQVLLSRQAALASPASTSAAAAGTASGAPAAAAAAAMVGSPNTHTTYGMAREIMRARGPTGLFFGFGSHLLRESLGGAVYFSSYELSKFAIGKATGAEPNLLVHVLSGAVCGTFAWTIIFPTDVIKSTIQRDTLAAQPRFRSVWACASSLYATGGLRIFYRGISATMIRAAPIHSLNWAVYEGVLRFCTRESDDDAGERAARA